jgi:DNA-binding NarL/FixJ family response regulator
MKEGTHRPTVMVLAEGPLEATAVASLLERAGLAAECDCLRNRGFLSAFDALLLFTADIGTEDVVLLRSVSDDVRVVIVHSKPTSHHVSVAAEIGAAAIVPRSISGDLLVEVVEIALAGLYVIPAAIHDTLRPALDSLGLNEREKELLRRLARCKSPGDLAIELGYSRSSMNRRLRGLYGRLGVTCREEALLLAGRVGADMGDDDDGSGRYFENEPRREVKK